MNKVELISRMAEIEETTKKAAGEHLDAVVTAISEALAKGEEVKISGFGTFSVTERAAREGRNPARIKTRCETTGSVLYANPQIWFLIKDAERMERGIQKKVLDLGEMRISLLIPLRSYVQGPLCLVRIIISENDSCCCQR